MCRISRNIPIYIYDTPIGTEFIMVGRGCDCFKRGYNTDIKKIVVEPSHGHIILYYA